MLRLHHQHPEEGAKVAQDPVCGMSVDVASAEYRSVQGETTYYFCSPGCKQAFDQNPQRYVAAAGGAKPEARS
jgi:Cu+-exporting ATPase